VTDPAELERMLKAAARRNPGVLVVAASRSLKGLRTPILCLVIDCLSALPDEREKEKVRKAGF